MTLPQISVKTSGAWEFTKFLIKHWYLVIIILSIIPSLILSIKTAVSTNNPSYPFVELALTIVNADSQLFNYISILETNPSQFIPMINPVRILQHIQNYWEIAKTIWLILGTIFLITIPFNLFYRFFKGRNTSEPIKNIFMTILFGMIFIFIINLILVIVGLIQGTIMINFSTDWDIFKKTWYVIKQTLPFHGVIELIKYIFTKLF